MSMLCENVKENRLRPITPASEAPSRVPCHMGYSSDPPLTRYEERIVEMDLVSSCIVNTWKFNKKRQRCSLLAGFSNTSVAVLSAAAGVPADSGM